MLSTSILTNSASTLTASTRAYNYKPSQGILSTLTTSKITTMTFKGTLMAFTTFSRPLRKSALCMYPHYDFVYFCFTKKIRRLFLLGKKLKFERFLFRGKVRNEILIIFRFREGFGIVFTRVFLFLEDFGTEFPPFLFKISILFKKINLYRPHSIAGVDIL
jgi:hypothetical protein